MIKTVKIPEDRIGVLKSSLKKIEESTNTMISLDENNVKINGSPIDVWKAKDIVKAIGRGFSPVNSLKLLNDDVNLEIIELKKYLKTQKSIKRIKSRIIGRDGKTRKKIEEYTGSVLSIYGDTVSIISNYEKLYKAKEGILMLINGATHKKVYNYLKRLEVG